MSYVRTKTIKGHDYLYEVESVREGGKVRQKHIRYIGPAGSAHSGALGTTGGRVTPSPEPVAPVKSNDTPKEPKWHNFGSEERKHYYNPEAIKSKGNYQVFDFDVMRWWTFKDEKSEDSYLERYPFANMSKPGGEEKVYYRFGLPPETQRSMNYAENRAEGGVSVYTTPSGSGGAVFFEGRAVYSGKGRQVGWGSDGEPLIIVTGKWSKIS